jgi:sugar O-acyltransferase (sialic acid O-acetyltransferase NeuD family)
MGLKIAIIGAGGFGREVKTIIDAINKVEFRYDFSGYYDDGVAVGTVVNGFPVLGSIEDLNLVKEELCLVLAIGNPHTKRTILSKIKNNVLSFPNLIHPSVIISDDFVVLGKGNIICAGTILTCNIKIEDFVILNLCCTVGHDTIIESYCSFMPSVNISGEVVVKRDVYVGTGAKIINQLEIGESVIVGSGAVVAKSLPSFCTAVGVPAKPIKFSK